MSMFGKWKLEHQRQLRHNIGEGFVFGYYKEDADNLLNGVEVEVKRLLAENESISLANGLLVTRVGRLEGEVLALHGAVDIALDSLGDEYDLEPTVKRAMRQAVYDTKQAAEDARRSVELGLVKRLAEHTEVSIETANLEGLKSDWGKGYCEGVQTVLKGLRHMQGKLEGGDDDAY